MQLLIAAGVPSAIVAFCFWLLERRIQERAEAEKASWSGMNVGCAYTAFIPLTSVLNSSLVITSYLPHSLCSESCPRLVSAESASFYPR